MKEKVQKVSYVLLFLALCATFAHAGTSPKGKPFVAINDQIVEVKGAISSLQEQIEILVGRVDTMEQRIAADQQAILSLQERSSSLEALVLNSLTTLADIQAEIDYLKAENANLSSQLASLTDETTTTYQQLQSDIDSNNAMIADLENSILLVQDGVISLETSLQGQIDNNSSLISAIQDEIAYLNAKLEEKQNLINGYCPDGEAAQKINPDGSIVCGAAGGGTTGQLEMTRVYNNSSTVHGTVPFGQIIKVNVFCEPGWTASGTGVNMAAGWEIIKNHTEGPDENGLSWASIQARNINDVSGWFVAVANCMRLAP